MTLPLADDALDDRLGFVGTTGSGKTYAAGTAVERLLKLGARCVIVDPLDVWWGMRLLADGVTSSGFNVIVFGGAHGDMPITEHSGAVLGEAVAGMAESCIVSLGQMASKSAERRFMLAFLDAIYQKADPAKYGPFHIIFDEADLFAPQKAMEPALQSRMEEIVRRGRVRGFIPWLITQRPAVISKDVLSQVDGLVAMKLTASQDRDALGAWIEGMADRAQGREILGSLPSMQRGQGVVWIPGRGVLKTTTFPAKITYDSSRTPKRGENIRATTLKPLDLSKLHLALSAIEAETKSNDPKSLKAEIARLRLELSRAQKPATPPKVPVTANTNSEQIESARRDGEIAGISIGIARAQQALAELRVDIPLPAPRSLRPQRLASESPSRAEYSPIAADGLTVPQQRILNALAWWRAFGIEAPTNEQAGFIASYAPGSGNFNNIKGQLRTLGYIDYPAAGCMRLTDQGAALAETLDLEVTQTAFHAQVRAKLKSPQIRLLDPVLSAYPDALSTQEVAAAAEYAVGSGNFNNLRGQLRTIGLIDYPAPNQIRAADWLFP